MCCAGSGGHLNEFGGTLERHRTFKQAEALTKGKRWNNGHDLMITSKIGSPLEPVQFGISVPKICKQVGLGHWSIHELRHSCTSIMIAM
jgi:integrase